MNCIPITDEWQKSGNSHSYNFIGNDIPSVNSGRVSDKIYILEASPQTEKNPLYHILI